MATFVINFGVSLLLGVVQGLLTPKPDGPRLNDRSVPKATYGVPIPKVYGTALVPANMIWGIPRAEQRVGGGKGLGGGKGGANFKYFGSFAMLFSLGPVVGISRMWANGKIVMDYRSNPDAPPPTRNDPPSSPNNGDKYTVGTAPTGEWTGQTGLIAEWQTAKWYFYPAATTSLEVSNRWKQYWRFYNGSSSQMPDPLIQAKEGADRTPAYRGYCYAVAEGLPLNDDPNGGFDFGANFPSIKAEIVTKGSVDENGFFSALEVEIFEIVQDVCELVKIPTEEIDVSPIEDLGSVFGYTQDFQVAAKQIISDLASVFFFDIQDGAKLRFLPPNRSLSGAISEKDLGTRVFGSERPNSYSLLREDITQLPYEINLVYYDQQRNLLENTVTGRYSQGNNVNVTTVNIPITTTQSKAQSAINRAIQLAWIRRKKYERLLLPPKYLNLQAGDRIQIAFSDRTDDLVISAINTGANGIREITAFFYSGIGQAYTQTAVPNNIPLFNPLRNEGSTVFFLLDINLVQDADNDNGVYVAARGTTQFWNRYALFGSRDGGANYGQLLTATGATTMGVVAAALGDFTGSGVDTTNTISVVLESGSLISPTGLFLLGDEILSANTATLTAVNTYTLSDLVRGQRGTEWAIADHGTNERFYILAECDRAAGLLSDLNVPINYKALTTGQALGDVSATTFTTTGRALKPYAPKSVSAYKPVDDIIINWIRRDRKDNSSVGTTPRLSEYNERYEIDIFDGVDVARTLFCNSPTVTYTEAQQIADFGVTQTEIVIKVYQISETVGRGYAASYSSGTLGTTSPIVYPVVTPTASSAASAAQSAAETAQTTANAAVPQTRTITINGITQNLSADRSWSIAGGGIPWNVATADLTGTTNNFYVNQKAVGQLQLTLPTTSALNDEFGFCSAKEFGVAIAQQADQYIQNEEDQTFVGPGNGIESTAIGTAVRLVCIEANKGWLVTSKLGLVSNFGIPFDADAVVVIDAIEATGVTLSVPQKTAIINRIVDAKSDGVWAKWRAYYGFVGGTAAAHAINWKDASAHLITWNGTLIHNSSGVKGDGATGYGDTNLSPNSVLTFDNLGLGFYLTDTKASEASYDMGTVSSGTGQLGLYIFSGSGALELSVGERGAAANNRLKQYFSANRIDSTASTYRDGALVASSAASGGALTTQNMFILGRNNTGALQLPSTARYGSFSINTGLTDAEETANYISELAFQTALSRN